MKNLSPGEPWGQNKSHRPVAFELSPEEGGRFVQVEQAWEDIQI